MTSAGDTALTQPTARRAPFAALIGGYLVSVLGTAMSELAIPWFVLTSTGSAAKTGIVAFAELAPYVLMQVLAGPIVERVGLRRSFVWGNSAAALAVGAVPVMYAFGGLSLGVLIALVAIAGAVRGSADCANSALVPATAAIGRIPLERAAGLNATANRSGLLLGAPLGGLLVTLTNAPTVVLLDAITFAIAAFAVAIFVRGVGPEPAVAAVPTAGLTVEAEHDPVAAAYPAMRRPSPARESALRRYGRDLAEGLRFISHDRLLLGIVTMVAVANLLDQGISAVLLPVWVRQELHSAAALGVIGGALGIGEVGGALLGAWLGPRLPRRALYGVGFLLGAAPRFIVLVLATTISPVLVIYVMAGLFGGSINSVIGATSYERIPTHLQPRVLGVIRASAWLGMPFGALVAGFAVEATNLRAAILIAGVCYFATTLAPFIFPAWRDMRRPSPAPVEAVVTVRAPA
jgi:MFS family permease